jgi:hypothetical protein
MLRSQSFPRIGSNMSHSYTLERCATFPTNILGLIVIVTLPLVWGLLPSFSKSCRELANSVIYLLHWTGQRQQSDAIPAETLKSSSCRTRWGRYGLPPTIVPRGNTARPSRLKIYGTKKKLMTCSSHSKICGQRRLYGALESLTNFCY